MSISHPSSIRPFLVSGPRHHVFPKASFFQAQTALLLNDGALPTTSIFAESFEENFLPNGASLPNSAHKSVPFLYLFLVLTVTWSSARRQSGPRVARGEATSASREVQQVDRWVVVSYRGKQRHTYGWQHTSGASIQKLKVHDS
jgi:hypothetical protein